MFRLLFCFIFTVSELVLAKSSDRVSLVCWHFGLFTFLLLLLFLVLPCFTRMPLYFSGVCWLLGVFRQHVESGHITLRVSSQLDCLAPMRERHHHSPCSEKILATLTFILFPMLILYVLHVYIGDNVDFKCGGGLHACMFVYACMVECCTYDNL